MRSKLADKGNIFQTRYGITWSWTLATMIRRNRSIVISAAAVLLVVYSLLHLAGYRIVRVVSLASRVATPKISQNRRLFYNRVPKCGSSTLVTLMDQLASRNGFEHHSSPLLDDWGLFREADQNQFVKGFNNLPSRIAFDRHLLFLDFTRFGLSNPIYINLIRDPTDRYISEFFFRRRLQENSENGVKKWMEEDLNVCIEAGKDSDCRLIDGTFIKSGSIPFFCGHKIEFSRHNNRAALDEAKRNVEQAYEVVGVLEDLELTLKVLEDRIPAYFAGVHELYKQLPDRVINPGTNKAKNVSEQTKDLIRKNLTLEYEFYHFVRQRLRRQSQTLRPS